ncbi:MAG: SAM-dependent methyltransferase, partial [Bacteroidales bacterium]|nr:SAM-dependent methyltransferase [Bacteroidales bacterium]
MKQLPDDFIRQMRSLLGDDADAFLQAASQDDASVSVRLNRRKAAPLSFEETTPVTWCPQGYYLSERPSFTLDPLFHAGAYYVQEASSMFLWTAVQQALRVMEAENRPLKVLDLCAAPGGKSNLLLDVLPEGSVWVANEIVHSRANILAENLTKWGYPHVIVTEAKP